MKPIHTIDDVIDILQDIINESTNNKSPLGYFAALYQKVTIKVKEGIQNNYFDDNQRMEKLDIIFAKRYIEAYYNYQNNIPITSSWEKAFSIANKYWYIVLQHLLVGMNAHINLDLGIAAAEVSKGKDIQNLHSDFNKINDILSSLVNDVQDDLAKVYPFLKKILTWTKDVDDFLVDFSMELARNGAWDFAVELANTPTNNIENTIHKRDIKITEKADLVISPGFIPKLIFMIIRVSEIGTVTQKIKDLTD
ncbi:DUF5995 family protein [Tenacibaculum singaporense]|uniref:Uncharacterized protein n=1 Tax=Tenacibaculum singaporense TaxID=2358479 RepID=A0A3S5HI95_9FLAO|nr:DUF5995 family protein [Tenacibaculum singaporense]AZJ36889.1 hypothetical protein D6T69_15620 [Tenacibaculum singaporense]